MTTIYQSNEDKLDSPYNGGEVGNNAVRSNEYSTIAYEFKVYRQRFQEITTHLQKAADMETLLRVTVAQIRDKLSCDRVLIYQFTSNDTGDVLAESRTPGWTPAVSEKLPPIFFGLYTRQDYVDAVVIDDVHKIQLTPYQKQLLEKLQVRASLSLPIMFDNYNWGLIVIHSCTAPRQWQEPEITLLSQISTEVNYRLQGFRLDRELQQSRLAKQSVAKVITKILQQPDVDQIFQATTQEVRQFLKCDRVGVYRFNADWSGQFLAEAVGNNWNKIVTPEFKMVWEDSHLQETKGGRYAHGETFVVNDIYKAGHTQCHVDILEQIEVKAYMIAPIFSGEKLWGLLGAYQNNSAREWQDGEISFLTQIGLQFGIAISQGEYLEQVRQQSNQLAQIAQQEKALTKIVNRIRQSFDVEDIFKTTTQEVRLSLKCDRVAVYQFSPDWGGQFVYESVGTGWTKLVGPGIKTVLDDTYLQETKGGRYVRGENFIVNDTYKIGLADCHIEILEQFEAKAYIIVPIFLGEKLWGLLAAYQNSGPREWRESEVSFLEQIGLQFSIAKAQIDSIAQIRAKSDELAKIAEQEKTINKIVNRIRQSLDLNEIFRTATQEIRQLIKCDRVAIYQFNPDWSGEFIAESVTGNWIKLVGLGVNTVWEDSHLQETQGGRYAKGENFAVNDIYQADHAQCHIDILEQFQVRAYVIVPIFYQEQLWGLLAAYQNSGPREWQNREISLLTQIGLQFSLAKAQIEYLRQLELQSTQLSTAADREKSAKELLQQRSIQLLKAVRPALNGDLTVRAPLTEDELGTIADAYNNTIQALRQIVIQVQASSQQVVQISNSSDASLLDLTHLAKQQSEEISGALTDIQRMVDSTQAVVTNAQLVQIAVEKANKTVDSGDNAMNQTVNAIQAIRETVAQTGKKIKRLSESSQKISKVVNLISSFATQTNVLALNAAIEATRAGEYGKGFGVVADEVRSLSRQSASATIEIEKLVQEIQAETGEVAVAMELGIQQVVEGTNLVSQTRQNLNDIVAVTAEISELIGYITEATQKQMTQSGTVTTSMNSVAAIANKTFGESQEIATLLQELSGMAQDLLKTASKFKVN